MRVQHHFFVCITRRPEDAELPSCAPRGGCSVYDALLGEIRRRGYPQGLKVTATGCLTPCQHGPNLVVYPQGTWYADVTPGEALEILAAHVDHGIIVPRKLLPEAVRV